MIKELMHNPIFLAGNSEIATKEDFEVTKDLLDTLMAAPIIANYYTCTDEILEGLGKMYVADERFKKNLNKYGEGTAAFAADAIATYTNKI